MDIQMASIVLQDAARYMALASGHEYAKPGAENWCLRIALTRLNEACGHLDLSLMPRVEEAKAAQTPGACTIKKARDVREGDRIAGHFEVAEISHGPLPHQVRFRNGDETSTAFFYENEALVIEVRS